MNQIKKLWIRLLLVVVGLAVGIAATVAVYYFSGEAFNKNVSSDNSVETEAPNSLTVSNAELTAYAFSILNYIKSEDYEALSKVVHPEYGVVFSPYATISLSSNKCFTATQIAGFANDDTQYVWGKYDGSDNPIELTPAEYFKEFVFDKDFTQTPEIGIDTIIKSGNSLENITDVFPDVRFVDFHFPAADSESDGLDWTSLRFGFEEYNGSLKLTVVVHSEWTV